MKINSVMKYLFLLALLSNFAICGFAQTDNKIVIGKVDSVYSTILGEQRKVWVYSPAMHPEMNDSADRYPVVYLLDGDAHFESVVGMIRQLSEVNGNTDFPKMIVVGIPNTNRTRDLTPTHIQSDPPMMDSNFSKSTGGGEKFVSFMERELMPHIDSLYPVRPYRLLIGHSFGGLSVMNILTNHTNLFNAYIAIDPSMWYDKERFLSATKEKLAKNNFDNRKLFIGIANTMPDPVSVAKMLRDTSAGTRHMRSIFSLDAFLKSTTKNGLIYASKYYPDDDHGSVPMNSEYDGLRFIFRDYKLKLSATAFKDSTTALANKIQAHYALVSTEMGYKVSPSEKLVNYLADDALKKKFYAKADAFYKMNMANFPSNGSAYSSYASFFIAKKDTTTAIAYLEKAYDLNKSMEVKQTLNELQGKAAFTIPKEELGKYAGDYKFETVDLSAKIFIKDDHLMIEVPGQPGIELVPLGPDIFGMKALKGYQLNFEMAGGKPVGFSSSQPNGTFKAKLK